MRFCLMALTLPLLANSAALAGGVAGNARDLRELLMAGHRPATVESVPAERGCGPSGCSIDIDGLSILRERGVLARSAGGRIRLEQHPPGSTDDLPEMDWELLEGFKVLRAGKRWGSCLEFGHAGPGKSGRWQRWTSVVLVPWKGSRPSTLAHRFVGYWAACDSLEEGKLAGEVVLPAVEPASAGTQGLHIVRNHCTATQCTRVEDSRSVNAVSGSESGALAIDAAP